jgi:hypothetical protein
VAQAATAVKVVPSADRRSLVNNVSGTDDRVRMVNGQQSPWRWVWLIVAFPIALRIAWSMLQPLVPVFIGLALCWLIWRAVRWRREHW